MAHISLYSYIALVLNGQMPVALKALTRFDISLHQSMLLKKRQQALSYQQMNLDDRF